MIVISSFSVFFEHDVGINKDNIKIKKRIRFFGTLYLRITKKFIFASYIEKISFNLSLNPLEVFLISSPDAFANSSRSSLCR